MATTFAVPDGRVAMAATTYTGSGSTSISVVNTINTVSFQPDLVWVKQRNIAQNNELIDSVRGVGTMMASDQTNSEYTATTYGQLTSFNPNGFTASKGSDATYSYFNQNTGTYIAWQWKAGTSTITNNSGTLSSQVNANTTTGFSIVTWTGTGSGATSIGHGLPVLPQLVFVKKRNVAENWYVGAYANQGLNYAYHLFLNTTGASSGNNDPYVLGSQTSLTSNVLQLADGVSGNGGNQTGTNYVAYCWAPVAGYSAFGSYTGNGSTDGPFIYTGFRPRFVMIKGVAISSWYVWDSSRSAYNVINETLYPNLNSAENGSGGIIDFLSNGFKIRTTGSDLNTSGNIMTYAAFAENPLKYSNAR